MLFGKACHSSALARRATDDDASHCVPFLLSISLTFRDGYRLWQVSKENEKSGWVWPLGLAAGIAGVAVMLLRGCWHGKMSWPIRVQQHSYQVCIGCGIKRLFDEKAFRAYGPFSYDLARLIAWDRNQQVPVEIAPRPAQQRPAS